MVDLGSSDRIIISGEGLELERVLRDSPGRPLERKCKYPDWFLMVFARREGTMCENHVLSTILPL